MSRGRRRAQAIAILLDHGAEINAENGHGKTGYAHAARRGFADVKGLRGLPEVDGDRRKIQRPLRVDSEAFNLLPRLARRLLFRLARNARR